MKRILILAVAALSFATQATAQVAMPTPTASKPIHYIDGKKAAIVYAPGEIKVDSNAVFNANMAVNGNVWVDTTKVLHLGVSNFTSGAGTPEGAVTAPVGSVHLRTDGSTSTTLYIKTSGSGNTGWTAK